jgi:hypothetical protein
MIAVSNQARFTPPFFGRRMRMPKSYQSIFPLPSHYPACMPYSQGLTSNAGRLPSQ